MANQEPIDIALHNQRKAFGTVGAEGLHAAGGNVRSTLPVDGSEGDANENAVRRNYAAGTQTTSGSG